MKRTNYHIHTLWCDGSASCAEMAKAAYDAGMDSIGFSSHFTMTYPDDCGIEAELIPDYLRETARIRSVYEPLGMEVLTSFEADYYMDTGATKRIYFPSRLNFRKNIILFQRVRLMICNTVLLRGML